MVNCLLIALRERERGEERREKENRGKVMWRTKGKLDIQQVREGVGF